MGDEMQEKTASTEVFKARNGLNVRQAENGGVEVGKPGYLDYTTPAATFALEEFFQAKRDEEFGRWRWPENPDYVVYEKGDGWIVLSERSANSKHYSHREHAEVGKSELTQAARAHFEAHPEPKPWRGAECGESWYLEPFGVVYTCLGDRSHSTGLWFSRSNVFGKVEDVALTDERITDARRIWPEVERTTVEGVSSQAGLASFSGKS